MASAERERQAEKALRHLTKSFYQLMSADIRIDLCGKDIFTWNECERIENAAKRSNKEGIDELLKSLRRKGARGLDALVEALEEEEGPNQEILEAIRAEWPKKSLPESAQPPPKGTFAEGRPLPPAISSEAGKELLGNGEWPFERQSDKPIPPVEGVDFGPKDAYKMTSQPRGTAIIINNRNFTCGMKDRVGTDIDAEALTRLFIYLGFYTNRYDNLKGIDFGRHLQDVADLNHSKFDCLIVAILTHGTNDKFYSTDGGLISVEDVTSYFDGLRCPSLIGKPKVFIFQFDTVVERTLYEVSKSPLRDETDGGSHTKSALPTKADFILAYAMLPSYVSDHGSWFIKAFTDAMFELSGKEHFMDILTEVNRRIAEEFQSKSRTVSMLTRKLYFRPGCRK